MIPFRGRGAPLTCKSTLAMQGENWQREMQRKLLRFAPPGAATCSDFSIDGCQVTSGRHGGGLTNDQLRLYDHLLAIRRVGMIDSLEQRFRAHLAHFAQRLTNRGE